MNVGKRIDESILKWRNKMLWLSMLFLSVSLFSDEVSVFGAGNLDDELPYGLNQTEKKIVENNNKIKKLKSKNNINCCTKPCPNKTNFRSLD